LFLAFQALAQERLDMSEHGLMNLIGLSLVSFAAERGAGRSAP
jgi:hypothetical protein